MTTHVLSHGARLAQLAQTRGDSTGLVLARAVGDVERWTFGGLEERSNQIARLLQARGVNDRTVVTMVLRNSAELVLLCYATWKLGACTLPLSPNAPARELEGMLAAAEESGRQVFVVSQDGFRADPARSDLHVSELAEADTLDAAALPDRIPQPGKAIGSGGSTGRSKIIVDVRPWAAAPSPPGSRDPFGRRPEHVVFLGGPLYHNGPFGPLFAALFDGTTVVLMQKFDAARAVELIEEYRAGWTFMVPTQMSRIARLPSLDTSRLASLEGVYHSGAFCADWLKRRWLEIVGPRAVVEVYGFAEQVGATFITGDEWLAHNPSVGQGIATDIRILDPDGQDVPPGEVGAIYLRWKEGGQGGFLAPVADPTKMYDYWGSPRLPTTPDGFSSAGDLGWLDEDGYLYLADRRTDLIITGGANVYPAEVESVLSAVCGVEDVAVVGLPDDDWGHRVHAIVQTGRESGVTEDQLDAACREHLAPYKRPKSYELLEELPRDESGKIRRSALRQERATEPDPTASRNGAGTLEGAVS